MARPNTSARTRNSRSSSSRRSARNGQIWSKDVLLALLDEITAKYAVDTNRIYLTGLSMGGYGTWDLGLTYPEQVRRHRADLRRRPDDFRAAVEP